MRALQLNGFGGVDVLEVRDVPLPIPRAGEVRIRVAAAGLNPVDVQTRSGALVRAGVMLERSVGLGWDVAGYVDMIGESADSHLRLDDAVVGISDRVMLPVKTHAEFVVLPASSVARVPDGRDLVELATAPLNATTASQAIEAAGLQPGETLLVTGAAGAVGGYVVQLASQLGLRVVATARSEDEDAVRQFGASEFLPAGEQLPSAVRQVSVDGADAVIDAAQLGLDALDALRGGATFVSLLGPGPVPLRGVTVRQVWVRSDQAVLDRIARTSLIHRVSDTFALDDAADAHRALESRGLRGRPVFTFA